MSLCQVTKRTDRIVTIMGDSNPKNTQKKKLSKAQRKSVARKNL